MEKKLADEQKRDEEVNSDESLMPTPTEVLEELRQYRIWQQNLTNVLSERDDPFIRALYNDYEDVGREST